MSLWHNWCWLGVLPTIAEFKNADISIFCQDGCTFSDFAWAPSELKELNLRPQKTSVRFKFPFGILILLISSIVQCHINWAFRFTISLNSCILLFTSKHFHHPCVTLKRIVNDTEPPYFIQIQTWTRKSTDQSMILNKIHSSIGEHKRFNQYQLPSLLIFLPAQKLRKEPKAKKLNYLCEEKLCQEHR